MVVSRSPPPALTVSLLISSPRPLRLTENSETPTIEIQNVKGTVLAKTIEFMTHHVTSKLPEIEKVRRGSEPEELTRGHLAR